MRGSTAWKTSAGNDTWLAATDRSGSRSQSASMSTSVSRCTARCRALSAAGNVGLNMLPPGAITRTLLVSPAFWATSGPRNARTAKKVAACELEMGTFMAEAHLPARSGEIDHQRAVLDVHRARAPARAAVSSKPLVVEEALGLDGALGPRAKRGLGAAGGRAEERLHPGDHRLGAVGRRPARPRGSCRAGTRRAAHRGRRASTRGRARWRRSCRRARARAVPASTSFTAGKIRPSWKSSVHWALSVPGNRPPMSMWWAIEPGPGDDARRRGRAGVNTCRSGVWVPPMYGWLVRKASPSAMSSPHFCDHRLAARTASGRAARGSARSSRSCGRRR